MAKRLANFAVEKIFLSMDLHRIKRPADETLRVGILVLHNVNNFN